MATPIIRKTKLLQPFWADPDHYWSVINTYYRLTKRHETLAKWTQEEFDSYVVNVLAERLHSDDDQQPLRMLGVGSGDGYQERLQLMKLKNKFPQISAAVVDPDMQMITDYKEMVRAKSSDFTGIEFEWHNKTFQEYMRSTAGAKKYHFITVIHAMYYAGETEAAVTSLYEMLEPGGILFIILEREHQGQIPVSFPDQHTVVLTPRTANDRSLIGIAQGTVSSEDVITLLKRNRFAFTQSKYTETTDVTVCFTQQVTKEANLLMDYMTLSAHFRESVPNEIFDMAIKILKSNACVEKSDDGDERFYVNNQVDILVISK